MPSAQYLGIVFERERRQVVEREVGCVLALRAGSDATGDDARRIRDKHHWVGRQRVGAELPAKPYIDAGLFLCFADGRLLQRLAGVDKAGGKGPRAAVRYQVSLDQQQPAPPDGDDADSYFGIVEVDVTAGGTDRTPPAVDAAPAQRAAAAEAESRDYRWPSGQGSRGETSR